MKLMALIMIIPLFYSFLATVSTLSENSEEILEGDYMEISYRSEDYPLFVSTSETILPKALCGDEMEMLSTGSFRIPSILRAVTDDINDSDVLIAAIDRASAGADWGKIDIAIRRSTDNGSTWTPLDIILRLPVHHAPQKANDWHSAFYIDPVLVQAGNGNIILVVDMYPECKGLHQSMWLESRSSYKNVDGKDYFVLYSEASDVGKTVNTKTPKKEYTIRENGWIYTPKGEKTNYYIPQKHSRDYGYETMGDMYFAVGCPDYIDSEPPLCPVFDPDSDGDIYVGNIFLSYNKPSFSLEKPVFVQKRLVGRDADCVSYSRYRTYETAPAPLRATVTSYIWMSVSSDYGETWSQPIDLNAQIREEQDDKWLITGPGVGIRLQNQTYQDKNNRIIIPLYNNKISTIIFSDDNGITWQRSSQATLKKGDETQCIETLDGSILIFGRQKGLGKTPVSGSIDGGETWRIRNKTDLVSVKCQKSIMSLPIDDGTANSAFVYPKGMEKKRQYVIASHPTGNFGKDSSRNKGVVTLGVVNADNSIEWLSMREVKNDKIYDKMDKYWDFYAYSCLTVLENGNIGLIFEAYPSGYIVFTQFNLAWILQGDQPIKAVTKPAQYLLPTVITAGAIMLGSALFVRKKKKPRKRIDN